MRARVVVMGFGKMGQNHLRVLGSDPQFELVAVVDPSHATTVEVPRRRATDRPVPVFPSLRDIGAERFDAVVVATPTPTHFEIGCDVVELGKALLMEKPFCSRVEECEELAARARRRRVPVAVGHTERFNPAVLALREALASGALGRPVHFASMRVGGEAAGRNVLLELAVHDIDLFRSLVGAARLVGSYVRPGPRPEAWAAADLLLASRDGASAALHVSFGGSGKARRLRVIGTSAVARVDYLAQTFELRAPGASHPAPSSAAPHPGGGPDSDAPPPLREDGAHPTLLRQPLALQARAFADLLARGAHGALCTPEDATAAVDLAGRAARAAGLGAPDVAFV